jgi:predicted chitinase
VTDLVLQYHHETVPQETGYWCGPASTQIVLDAQNILMAEVDLANELGTTTDGTNYIGQITDVLNKYIHAADYITVDLPLDPPTDAQVEEFWRNLRTSIDAGFGLALNFVSPANNPPRGIKGSESPQGYGNGTIYHYVTAMGWSDEPERAVWIADPGFAPFGYWISLRQCVVLMAPKGYSYARPLGAPGQPIPAGPEDAALLSYAMGDSLPIERYRELLPAVRDGIARSDCTNPQRVAEWLAQVGHESGGLKWMEELADGWAYEGRTDLGNTEPGDGPRFKGHGPIQITGRTNHTQVSEWAYSLGLVPSSTYFVEFPQELAGDRYGMLGAVWYWTVARPQINSLCDAGDIEGVTRAINGGTNGLEDRQARYARSLEVASAFLPGAAQPVPVEPPPAAAPAPAPVEPSKPVTCLTGYPHHHSLNEDTATQILNIRAEGLITQALAYAIAEKLGLDASGIYNAVRESF